MIRHLLNVNFDGQRGLQEQVRESLINAILSGIFPADTPLPSCRQLASQLNVSRNTTALVFESPVNEGYLVSRPRSGYYLHPDYYSCGQIRQPAPECESSAPHWGSRLKITPQSGIDPQTRWLDALPLPVYLRSALYPTVPAHTAQRQTGCTVVCATRHG